MAGRHDWSEMDRACLFWVWQDWPHSGKLPDKKAKPRAAAAAHIQKEADMGMTGNIVPMDDTQEGETSPEDEDAERDYILLSKEDHPLVTPGDDEYPYNWDDNDNDHFDHHHQAHRKISFAHFLLLSFSYPSKKGSFIPLTLSGVQQYVWTPPQKKSAKDLTQGHTTSGATTTVPRLILQISGKVKVRLLPSQNMRTRHHVREPRLQPEHKLDRMHDGGGFMWQPQKTAENEHHRGKVG